MVSTSESPWNFSGKGQKELWAQCVMWVALMESSPHVCPHHFSTPRNLKRSAFFEGQFSSPTASFERKFGWPSRCEGGPKPTFPFPRLVTRRPAIMAVSFKSWSCFYLILNNVFLSIDQNLQFVPESLSKWVDSLFTRPPLFATDNLLVI